MDQDEADTTRSSRAGALGGVLGRASLPRPLRGVVFDLDGTLLDTEPAYRQAFMAALAQSGRSIAPQAYNGLIGLPSSVRRQLLQQMFGALFPIDSFFEAYYRLKAAALVGGIALKPGVLPLLALLDRASLPCAVATSASASTASAHLAKVGLAGRFAAVVTRDDVVNGKPAPDSFIAAAARLGAPPANCLAVEDSYHGIEAAWQAGLMVVMVPDCLPSTAETLRCCVATLDTLAALAGYLAPTLMQPHPTMDRSPLRV